MDALYSIVTHLPFIESLVQRIRYTWESEMVWDNIHNGMSLLYKLIKACLFISILLSISTLLYALFYRLLIPTRVWSTELYFEYGMHTDTYNHPNIPLSSFSKYSKLPIGMQLPSTLVQVTSNRVQWKCTNYSAPTQGKEAYQILIPNTAYDVLIHFYLPLSPTNTDIGMFM